MNLEPHIERASNVLYTRIAGIESWGNVIYSRPPKWFASLLSSIVLATGATEPQHLSGDLIDEAGLLTGHLVFLMDEHVVSVSIATDEASTDTLSKSEVRVWSRSELLSFSVSTDAPVFGDRPYYVWPNVLTVEVGYPLATLTLSVGDSRSGVAPVTKFLDGLRRDLVS
ncbi:hypothetical protein ACL9RL_09375 [Plantibacter sp. Mn2098]|uniref:hypothetical protein n=1 Tax=Plantibacter sp. Mn2098 TaxID=3395266 RepID=UPI003BBCC442